MGPDRLGARVEARHPVVDGVAREVLGTTTTTFRGHEIDLAAPWKRVSFVEALAAEGVWSQDEGELRTLLDGRGIDTSHDRTWPQLVDHALSSFVATGQLRPLMVTTAEPVAGFDAPTSASLGARPQSSASCSSAAAMRHIRISTGQI